MRLGDLDVLKADLMESKEKLWEIYNGLRNHTDKRICGGQIASFTEAILRIKDAPTIDAVPVVRCKDCKYRNKKKCPLVMVRFDVKTDGTIKEVLEQNYVDEDFWCKDGKRKDGEG